MDTWCFCWIYDQEEPELWVYVVCRNATKLVPYCVLLAGKLGVQKLVDSCELLISKGPFCQQTVRVCDMRTFPSNCAAVGSYLDDLLFQWLQERTENVHGYYRSG